MAKSCLSITGCAAVLSWRNSDINLALADIPAGLSLGLRLDSAPFRIKEIVRKNAKNVAERTFGETFRQMSEAAGMSNRYQQSLKMRMEGMELVMELDYHGVDNNEPLGIWFEKGTKDHFISPKGSGAQFSKIDESLKGANVLSWVQDGKRFFSAGHFVRGITATHIMENMRREGMPKFKEKLVEMIEGMLEANKLR